MLGIISTLNKRLNHARNDRALARMIDGAGSPAMRDELIVIAQRQASINR